MSPLVVCKPERVLALTTSFRLGCPKRFDLKKPGYPPLHPSHIVDIRLAEARGQSPLVTQDAPVRPDYGNQDDQRAEP